MSVTNFDQLFEAATGAQPYPWQRALALRPEPASVVAAPTGSGKTEAVLLDWLWRRRFCPDVATRASTPRRLLVALPMRTLVEQTRDRVKCALARLEQDDFLDEPIAVYQLMGGAADDSWALRPEREAVLVGTIDMLVSRALNRGFGRRRSAWPIDFGLMNSDSLWVFDEVQLMDAAVATSCQLQAFRERFSVAAPARTLWMSATLEPSWLETVDHRTPDQSGAVGIEEADRHGALGRRLSASKQIVRSAVDPANAPEVAKLVLDEHERLIGERDAPRLTLTLANTVDRAIAVYRALATVFSERMAEIDCLLLHSRFRPADRERLMQRLDAPLPDGGRIVVSTQVVEAGIDLDAGALVTELAPWSSLVQRAGRLNRTGGRQSSPARFVWLDPGEATLEKPQRPYDGDQLQLARDALLQLDGGSFSPDAISAFTQEKGPTKLLGTQPLSLFLRAPDLLDLFDTDPTLNGDDPDVGRFIRLSEDLDVGVAWHDFTGNPNDPEQPTPEREEVCPVPIWERKALAALTPWRWSYSRRRWDPVRSPGDLVPGDLLLLSASAGGYDTELGWTGRKQDTPSPLVAPAPPAEDSDADDPETLVGRWISLEEHTSHVVEELEQILARIEAEPGWADALRLAARVHDAGKAHPEFQRRLSIWAQEDPGDGVVYAKAPDRKKWRPSHAFRHELVSALLLLERGGHSRELDLPAYLVAAHHGKLRLTPRVLPDDHDPSRLVCLGVGHGDGLPQITVAGERFDAGPLDLSLLRIGDLEETTWIERALDLLDELGPFRLAYLEALLRAADQRASRREQLEAER